MGIYPRKIVNSAHSLPWSCSIRQDFTPVAKQRTKLCMINHRNMREEVDFATHYTKILS
jgi:hypothetical protein